MNTDELRERARYYGDKMAFLNVEREMLAAADEWDAQVDRIANGIAALGEENEKLRKRLRTLWRAVVDGDIDRLSTSYALRDILDGREP